MKYVLILLLLGLAACSNSKEAARVLEIDGVDNIVITGHKWFSCGRDDFYSTGFVGTKNGRRVEGVVCSGLILKSSTIRY